jgi:ABC-type transport system involved in multi-copper enzyme maturation permease subunit
MSAAAATLSTVRRNQLLAVARQELRKNFFRWRGWWVYLLAFAPALIVLAHAISHWMGMDNCSLEDDTNVLAGIFQLYYLRLGIFFGCMGIFTRLIRGDMMERSLHYYLLAPIRREIVVLGKFLAGVGASSFFFCLGVFLSYLFMYLHHDGPGRQFMLSSVGMSHLFAYLSVTVLACIGYGSLFLLTGLLFRNPIIPAVVVLLWEGINALLPALLKKISIIFYLLPLCPVEVPAENLSALFAISADPVRTWLSVPGLLIVSSAILAYACVRIRRVEIDYGGD